MRAIVPEPFVSFAHRGKADTGPAKNLLCHQVERVPAFQGFLAEKTGRLYPLTGEDLNGKVAGRVFALANGHWQQAYHVVPEQYDGVLPVVF